MDRGMSNTTRDRVPASGSCLRCGCALGHSAAERDGEWYCCGPCAGSDRCSCGCNQEYARESNSDAYVPGRRMFASRFPDELQGGPEFKHERRAYPFADRLRGR
jgi:hypothetical protein